MSGERIIPEKITTIQEYIIYLKEKFLYEWAKKFMQKNFLCLDLGCGDGYGTQILSEGDGKVIGLDIDHEIIEAADKKYSRENCKFQVYDGKSLPFSEASFDLVVCFHVIEHIKDDLYFLSEISRVLKTTGILLLATPNKVLRLPRDQKPWNIYHVREYTAEELKELLEKVFSNVNLLGLWAKPKIMELEIERFRRNSNLAGLDFLNLRRVIPIKVMKRVVTLIHLISRIKQRNTHIPYLDYNLVSTSGELFWLEPRVEGGLDIVAICRKIVGK